MISGNNAGMYFFTSITVNLKKVICLIALITYESANFKALICICCVVFPIVIILFSTCTLVIILK